MSERGHRIKAIKTAKHNVIAAQQKVTDIWLRMPPVQKAEMEALLDCHAKLSQILGILDAVQANT